MENMHSANEFYPFNKIKIKTPKALQGGTYSAKLHIDDNPIIVQTPKCKTKNGIHKTVKQVYCDLLMTQDNNEFITWLRLFQEKIRNLILENADNWFHEAPTLDEIEYNWNDSIRTYKGTNYLIRTFINKNKSISNISLQIFDSDENELTVDDLDNNKSIISIIEIVGLKFSSSSFNLEICLRQIMVLNEKPIFGKCLIKIDNKTNNKTEPTNKINDNMKPNLVTDNDNENQNEVSSDNKSSPDNLISEKDDIIETHENRDSSDDEVSEEKEELEDTVEDASDNILSNIVDNDSKKDNNLSLEVDNNEQDKEANKTSKNTLLDNSDIQEVNESHEIDESDSLEKTSLTQNLEKNAKDLEKINNSDNEIPDSLEEISLEIDESEPLKLKNPNEVYLDIYRNARERAKHAKNEAIKAYLEAKRIKELYLLDVVDSSDDDSDIELFSEK